MPDISLGVIIRLDNITAEAQRYLMLDTGRSEAEIPRTREYSILVSRFSLLDN